MTLIRKRNPAINYCPAGMLSNWAHWHKTKCTGTSINSAIYTQELTFKSAYFCTSFGKESHTYTSAIFSACTSRNSLMHHKNETLFLLIGLYRSGNTISMWFSLIEKNVDTPCHLISNSKWNLSIPLKMDFLLCRSKNIKTPGCLEVLVSYK